MATLNVKNLPDALYRKLQARAKRERRSVAQEVTQILSDTLETPKPPSILDLRGLGACTEPRRAQVTLAVNCPDAPTESPTSI